MKINKLTIECEDSEGNRYEKILEGKDAQKWYDNNVEFCILAEELGKNYKWHNLKWKQVPIKSSDKPVIDMDNTVWLKDLIEESDRKNK